MTKKKTIPEGSICELCGKAKVGDKRYARHHIDYDNDITIIICYSCHMQIHARLRFYNPWEGEYGVDKGFYHLAKAFIEVYEGAIKDI